MNQVIVELELSVACQKDAARLIALIQELTEGCSPTKEGELTAEVARRLSKQFFITRAGYRLRRDGE